MWEWLTTERRASERQEETFGGGDPDCGDRFSQSCAYVDHKAVHVNHIQFMVCQLYTSVKLYLKRNITGLMLFLLESGLDCVFLNTQPLLPNI